MATIDDKKDYRVVMDAMKALGFSFKYAETVWKIIGAILHLVSNFHIVQSRLRHGLKYFVVREFDFIIIVVPSHGFYVLNGSAFQF